MIARARKACFKFVCSTEGDVAQVAGLCADNGIKPAHVWIMPYGSTPEEVLQVQPALTKAALQRGFNATTRFHLISQIR